MAIKSGKFSSYATGHIPGKFSSYATGQLIFQDNISEENHNNKHYKNKVVRRNI